MKQLYFLFFLVFGLNAYAQNPDDVVYIPDANFKAKLLNANSNNSIASVQSPVFNITTNIWSVSSTNKIDLNNDGEIQISEAQLIKWLDISSSSITNLIGIESFTNLRYLNCKYNSINTLNLSQLLNLEGLNCFSSNISQIDLNGLTNLVDLNCQSNNLSNLNLQGLNNITLLDCSYNQLTSLSLSNLLQITKLLCSNNSLNQLDLTNLNYIKLLTCNNNQIQNLDVSNLLSVENINCSNNQIVNLDVQNLLNLKYLTCHSNQISQLDIENLINLEDLYCSANQISMLNFNNLINIQRIRCGNNLLTSLDLRNCPSLYRLECMNNQLNFINIKNGIHSSNLLVNNLYFSNNANLNYICCDDSEISSIKLIASIYNINCNVGSYCSFTPGGTFYTVQGNNKFDIDNNGCGVDDFNTANVKFIVSSGTTTGNFISTQTGGYSIPVQSGSHTLTPQLENPSYFTVSPASATVSFPTATSPYNQDFCITANGIYNDLEVTVIPISVARPGFDAAYKIIYKNKGNQVSNGTVNFSFDDTVMDFVSSIPVNDNSATNNLTWNFTNLNPFETREIDLVFNVNSPMETPAVNGDDILQYTATIVGATDETPNDNTFTLNQTVVNSYDPNDKICLEGATITPSMVGQYVHYVIRFENTGTFAAENIVVADIIDATKFDIATLVPQRSSHDFYTRINGNKVEFIFENINLPFDDANNDGYVAFKIKTKPTLVLGDTFTNSASIYFDYNFPIVTEPASTTVAALNINDFDFGSYFTVYPNPVKDVLNFKVKKEIGVKSVSVYNTLGQIVMAITNVDNLKDIDVSNLTAGSYFVKIYTDKGSSSGKFIKQ